MTQFKILCDSQLKINLKGKFENVASPISIKSSNEKIPCQHLNIHDENIIIGRVNDDCLAEIFMYIPIYERPKIALVCEQWNRALHYSWYKVKKLEFTHWQYRTPRNIFERFKKMNKFNFLKSLFDNCGRFLTELDMVGYDNSNIVHYVNESCPNLVKLRLRFIMIQSEELENAFSRMSKLKILKMIFQCTNIPATLLDSLEAVADTLCEFTLTHWSGYPFSPFRFLRSFPAIISQLRALQKIEITGMIITSSLRESIKNAGLNQFIDNYLDHMGTKNFRFNILSSLHLMDYEVTDDVLYNFANNIVYLQFMTVSSKHISDVGIQTITRMTSLSFLYLHGANQHITDSSIKLLKNLKELRLPYSNKITNASVTEVLKNSPKMRWLSIMHTGVTSEFSKAASEITSKREEYLRLCVSFDRNIFFSRGYQLPYLAIHHHDKNIEINKKFGECSSEKIDLVSNK